MEPPVVVVVDVDVGGNRDGPNEINCMKALPVEGRACALLSMTNDRMGC